MRQEYLRAAAESYANLSELQSDCYHYLNDGFPESVQPRLVAAYTKLLFTEISSKYINRVVRTALVECQYPINETTGYALNDTARSALAGIPKQTWSRHQMSDCINFILNNITQNANTARAKIQLQVIGYSEAT